MAINYDLLCEQMRRTYHELECKRQDDKTMIAQLRGMVDMLDCDNRRMRNTEKNLKSSFETVRQENSKLRKELFGKREKCADCDRLRANNASLKKCVDKHKTDAEYAKKLERVEREKCVAELSAKYEQQIETIKGDYDLAKTKIVELETQLSSITEQKRVLENANNLFQNQFKEQDAILSKLTDNNVALEANCKQLKDIKKAEALKYEVKIENLKKECHQIKTTHDNELKSLEQSINNSAIELSVATNKIIGYEKYFETSNKIVSELEAKTVVSDAKIKDLESKLRNSSLVNSKLEYEKKAIELKTNYDCEIESIKTQTNNVLKESAEKVTEFEKQNLYLKQHVTLINAKNVKLSHINAALETKLKDLTEKEMQRTNELENANKLIVDQKKEYEYLFKKYDTEKQNYAKLEKKKELQKKYYVNTNNLIKKKQLAAEYSLSGHEQIFNETANQFKEIMLDVNQTNMENLKRCLIEAVDTATKEGVEQTSIAVDRVNCAAQSQSESIISNASIIADKSNKKAECPDCHRMFEVHHLRRHLSTVHLKVNDDCGDAKRIRIDRTVTDVIDID